MVKKSKEQKKTLIIFLILLPFILIRLKYLDFVPFWDGAVYFKGLLDAMRANNLDGFNLLNYNFAHHPSMFYLLYLSIGQKLSFGNHIVLNIQITLISLISIYFFYQILNFFFKNNTFENILCTFVLTLCPLFIAASININLDFPILLFFIWFLYSLIYEKKILLTISSIALVLTNFSGILIIGVSSLLFLFVSFLSKSNIRNKFKRYSILMLIPFGFLFMNYLFEYLYRGSFWEKKFINPNYNKLDNLILDYKLIFARFIEIFVMNFHWILTIFIIAYFVKYITSKKENQTKVKSEKQIYMLLMILVFISLLLVFFKYKTFTNPRYIIPSLFFTIFFFYFALKKFFKKYPKVRILIFCLVFILFIFQNFYSIDPLSKSIYGTFKIGERKLHKMVSITGEGMGIAGRDQLVYNTQFTVISDLINKVYFELSKESEDFIIVYNEKGNWFLFTQYDKNTKKRNFRKENAIIPNAISIEDLVSNKTEKTGSFKNLFYVNLPWIENLDEDLKRLTADNEVGELKFVEKGKYRLNYCEITEKAPVNFETVKIDNIKRDH